MTSYPDTSLPRRDAAGRVQSSSTAAEPLVWTDVEGKTWTLLLRPRHVIIRADDETIDLPVGRWALDIFVMPQGGDVVIRVETFARTVRFALRRDEAEPLLSHLGGTRGRVAGDEATTQAEQAGKGTRQLLWPKVSPLAVWALICSSLTFIPWWGWGAACGTVILLLRHRKRIRRSSAWRHSRAICTAAVLLLVTGLSVSILAAWCLQLPLAPAPAVHPNELAAAGGREPTLIVCGLVVVLLALTVHEAAHAISAWWLGDDFARSLGRVTLNPLAHIDPFGTVLLPLLLVWVGGPVFGYARPVPVRVETLPRYRRAHILISLAGPGSNLLLAAVSLTLLLGVTCVVRIGWPEGSLGHVGAFDFRVPVTASGVPSGSAVAAVCTLLKLSFTINVVLAVFNLIPIPPLDGSWILEHLFPRRLGGLYAAVRPYGFIIFVAAIYLGLFRFLMIPVWLILEPGLALVRHATGAA